MRESLKIFCYFLIFSIFSIEMVFSCKPYINHQKERLDFENFIAKYDISYRTQKSKDKAFDRFIAKKGAIYTRYCINRGQCETGSLPLTSDAGVTKFFDLTDEQFKKHLNYLELERKQIDANFLDIDSFLQKNLNNSTALDKLSKHINNKNYLKKQANKKEEKTNNNNITNLIYFDLRDNEIIKNFSLLDFMSSNEKNEKLEPEIDKLINKQINSNLSNKIESNTTLKYIIQNYKENFNFPKLIKHLNSKFYSTILLNEEEESLKFKKFYHLLKFKSNEDLEYLVKNVGPVYIEINTSGITFYEKGIFNPHSCEMKVETGYYMGIVLVGYGKEGEFEYWIAKTFLGDNWGERKGYFRIMRRNEVDIFNPKMKIAIALELNVFKE